MLGSYNDPTLWLTKHFFLWKAIWQTIYYWANFFRNGETRRYSSQEYIARIVDESDEDLPDVDELGSENEDNEEQDEQEQDEFEVDANNDVYDV